MRKVVTKFESKVHGWCKLTRFIKDRDETEIYLHKFISRSMKRRKNVVGMGFSGYHGYITQKIKVDELPLDTGKTKLS